MFPRDSLQLQVGIMPETTELKKCPSIEGNIEKQHEAERSKKTKPKQKIYQRLQKQEIHCYTLRRLLAGNRRP